MSDEILVGVMKKVYELNIEIPEDVGILTISNGIIPLLFNPQITYIETSGYKLGKLAVKRMFDHLEGHTFNRTVLQPSFLIEGKSL